MFISFFFALRDAKVPASPSGRRSDGETGCNSAHLKPR